MLLYFWQLIYCQRHCFFLSCDYEYYFAWWWFFAFLRTLIKFIIVRNFSDSTLCHLFWCRNFVLSIRQRLAKDQVILFEWILSYCPRILLFLVMTQISEKIIYMRILSLIIITIIVGNRVHSYLSHRQITVR